MRTPRQVLAIPAMVLGLVGLAACGDDGGAASTTVTPATTIQPTTTVAKPTTTTAKPTTTVKPTTTTAAPTTTTTTDGVARISIIIGVDDAAAAGGRTEKVRLGQPVEITIVPKIADEFHLHGYDLEQQGTPGKDVVFSFTADQAGSFELEGHETSDVFLILEVA